VLWSLRDNNNYEQTGLLVSLEYFAYNPVCRGETIGSYSLVFNTLMNWDTLNAGRVLDAR
jgi:hypothetical protein